MPGIIGDDFLSLLSPLATAQYRPTPAAAFPNAPAPGPLSIPPAQPPIFLSPPAPAGAAPAQQASPWDSIISGLNHHALTLMALGAGIAQGGVGKGLAAGATAAEGERNRQAQQLNFLQTYNALKDSGVPPQEAQAAISNPSLMRALAAKYLGPRSPSSAPSMPAAPTSAPAGPPNASSGATSSPSPTPASAANGWSSDFQGNAAMMLASPRAPGLPSNIAAGAAYSPSRNMWRDQTGNRFDLQGKAVA